MSFEYEKEAPTLMVLCVEDDRNNQEALAFCCGDSFDLTFASNATDACKIIRARGGEFSVVLMDIQLKGSLLDGIELAKLWRGKLETSTMDEIFRDLPVVTLPIIFLTAFGEHYQGNLLRDTGGNMVLGKPVDIDQLVNTVTSIVESKSDE